MKLHLPVSLRKCLLALMSAVVSVTTQVATAGVMHSDATIPTYTDYAQNRGRYVVGSRVNALLQYIRTDVDKGILIHYTDGTPSYVISNEQGVINSSCVDDIGAQSAISPTFAATVLHNGAINASYGAREVGDGHAINYSAIDIRHSNTFRLSPNGYDYMLQRQSKVQTDVTYIPTTTVTDMSSLSGGLLYHIGGGSKGVWDSGKNGTVSLTGAYSYNTGGINQITGAVGNQNGGTSIIVYQDPKYANGVGASLFNPLPNVIRAGDSGSPVFLYNEATGQYEYIAAQQSGADTLGLARGDVEWTHKTLESFNERIDMSQTSQVFLGAIFHNTGYKTDQSGNSAYIYTGYATDADGNILASYDGVSSMLNTWADLSEIKDRQNWYAYNSDQYLLRSDSELFFNENLVFTPTQKENTVILTSTVDLGVGYVEFNRGDSESASFTITSEEGKGYLLNSAGYVINEGVEVHIDLVNPADHMYEWRKIGAGDLYIEGSGDTNALLNLGGSGKTYLQQVNGYAAYNVLLNNGATVVIQDLGQIKRDVTFGVGGGTLDMNGNSMDWYESADADGRFTINALTEQAMITNTSADNVTLTYKESGNNEYLGSFSDSQSGALRIDYQGGGKWTLNSIRTDLSHHRDSGLTVSNGHVLLSGSITVHGMGSVNGVNTNRLVVSNDWHYADAAMNVDVKSGAVFELGSHARLSGDVSVAEGATFIMREGVKDRYEYVEGGALLEDTYIYRNFYGLKGNAHVDGSMIVEYSEGTTSRNVYDGNLSGDGSLVIKLGTAGAVLELAGDNSAYTGLKTLESGGLVATNATSLGDTSNHKWQIDSLAWIASQQESAAALLDRLTTTSTGTLALSSDTQLQLNLSDYSGLYLGAEEGKTVQYGTADEALNAVSGKWQLGGGGGELVVNFLLTGHNDLVLGAHEGATGTVMLANSRNDFVGNVIFNSQGIILKTADGGLGYSTINLSYGNAFSASYSESLNNISNDSDGVLIVDAFADSDLNLSERQSLSIGASDKVHYTGNIVLADGADYRFSSTNEGELRIESVLDETRNIIADAQGFVGGKVVLAGNDSWQGDITVSGHQAQAGSGQLSLTLGQDMTVSGNVLLRQGGILDIAGHQLTITQSLASDGGYVHDSAATGTLVFDTSAGEQSSNAEMSVNSVLKVGDNKLTLSGNNSYGHFYVEDGTLAISGNAAAKRESRVHLADGTTLELNVPQINFSIAMDENAGSASILSNNSEDTVFNNNILLGSGSHLSLEACKRYVLTGSEYGGKGATLAVGGSALTTLALQNTTSHTFKGTLQLNGDVRVESRGNADNMERSFAEICISGGTTTLWEETWNTIWNIEKLSGEGSLVWDSNTTHDYTSRLVLSGEGDFSGTITLNRRFNQNDRTHGAFIELAHNNAAKNADIALSGASASAVASLAVNADNAHIKGLSGNVHSYVYAGQSMADAALSGNNRPATTRKATLTIDTDADKTYTYNGTIGSASDSLNSGLSLVKDGLGTQVLTGSVTVRDLSVLAGSLSVNQVSILGNVELARGATLGLAEFDLTTDKSFAVLGSNQSSGAVFSGNLLLNGGTLEFEGDALLADGGVSLNVNSIVVGENVTEQQISFRDFQSLRAGITYTLASGDWTELLGSISISGLDNFYSAELSISNEGYLQMTLASLAGSAVWDGNDASREWSSVKFGQQSVVPAELALFDDVATNKNVIVTSAVSAKKAIFQTSGEYSVTAQNGGLATVGTLLVNGGGALVLNSGISVTGNAEIQSGELIVKRTGLVSGTVSGNGTLVIDWGESTSGAMDIASLNTLHIASGAFSAKGTLQLQNLILDADTRYIQSSNVNQSVNITSYGGTLELAGGSLSGTMTLFADTELNLRSGSLYLNTHFADNGATFTQTGNGTVLLNGAFSGHISHYVINSGTLKLEGSRNFTNMDTITVQNGAALLLTYGTGVSVDSVVLEGGAKLRLWNGGYEGNKHFTSNIRTEDGAMICGSLYGNNTTINGTISGVGTLIFDRDSEGSNQYTVNSLIQDSSDGALDLEMKNPDLILTAANTYSGGTHITGGIVRTSHAAALGTGAVTISGSGQLYLNTRLTISSLNGTGGTVYTNGNALTIDQQSGAAAFSGTIAAGGYVIKTGEGSSTFSGSVNLKALEVLNGALALTNNSVVDAASVQGGTLMVNGNNATLRQLHVAGGAVQIGGNTEVSSATVQDGVLTVTGSGNTFADLLVERGGEVLLNGNVALQSTIQNAGSITIGEGASFTLSYDDLVDGSFVLIDGTGSITYQDTISANNIFIGGSALSGMPIYDIVQGENRFYVSVSMPQAVYTWTGAQNGIWNSENVNWVSADTGSASAFKAYCNALFTQDAAQKVVTIGASGVMLNNMTVESGDYTFNGSSYDVLGTFLVKQQASATLNAIPNSVENLVVEGALNLGFGGTWTQSVDASSGVINKLASSELVWNPVSGKIAAHELNIKAGSLKSSATMQVDNMEIASSSTVTLNHASGTVSSIGSITGNGKLVKDAAGSLQLGDAVLTELVLKGGDTTINGTVVIANELSIGKESVVLAAGADVSALRYVSGNTFNYQPSSVTIEAGASLTITGDISNCSTSDSFLLAHWKNADSSLLLNGGTLKSENASMLMSWDSAGTFKALAGEARLKGVLFCNVRGFADKFILGSATEGSASVYIDSAGISGIASNDTVTLGEGSIIATANFSVSGDKAVDLVGTKGGTIINTNGHTVTLASGVAGSGKLVKTGAGTLNINSSSLNKASISVQQGVLDMSGLTLSETALSSLSLARGSALNLGNQSLNLGQNLTLFVRGEDYTQSASLNGNLYLNGGMLSFSANSLLGDQVALRVSGAISSAEGYTQVVSLQNSALLEHGTYMLMSGNFSGLTTESFILNGVQGGSLVLEDNVLWLNYDSQGSVIWNGSSDSFVWSSDTFGGYDSSVLDDTETVVFDDSATVRQVTMGSSVSVEGELIFNNTQEYSFNSSNINYAIQAASLKMNESGVTTINAELNINGEVSLSKGTLVLNSFADLDEAASVSLKDGATLDITGTTQSLANLEMEAGTTIIDTNGGGTVNLSGTCSIAGLLNVGTINTTDDVSIITGDKLATLQVLGGTTEISGYSKANLKNIVLADGASLHLVDGYTLGSGFNITLTGSAELDGALVVSGGQLILDASPTEDNSPLLLLSGSLTRAEGSTLNIVMQDVMQYAEGGTFALLQGDFSGFDINHFTYSGDYSEYVSLELNADKNILSMHLGSIGIWNGTEDTGVWNSESFGSSKSLTTDGHAFFNDSAACTDVVISEDVTLQSVDVESSKNYHFALEPGVSWLTDSFTMQSGSVTIGGEDASLTVNGKLYAKRGELNIGSSADDSVLLTVSSLEASDSNNAGDLTINLAEGSTLKITGNDVANNYKTTAFLLSEWNAVTTLNVDGTLLAQNASALVGDSSANINVSGVMAVKGIGNAQAGKDYGTVTLNMQDGAKLILGASGISIGKQFVANLGAATIAISSDNVTIAENLDITSASGTVFDTMKYEFASDGNSIVRGDAGGVLTLSGALSGSGVLIKEGLGTLKLAGNTANFNGDISINEGTLSIGSGASALLTADSNAKVVVNNDASLDLTELGASALLNNVSGTGVVLLNCSGSGSGSSFDFSTFGGTVQINSGRVSVNSSTFGEQAPTFKLTSGNSQLVFADSGETLRSDVVLAASTTFHVNGNSQGAITGHIDGAKHSLTIMGSGSLGIESATLHMLTMKGAGVTTINGEVTLSKQGNEPGLLSIGKQNVILADGANVTADQYRSGDTGNNQQSVVTIANGATLSVIGTQNAHSTSASFLLSHWGNSASSLILDGGELNASGAVLHTSWDSKGTFEARSGKAALNGINLAGHGDAGAYGNRYGTFVLGAAELTLGSGGIKNVSAHASVTLGQGSIIAANDFSITGSNAITLNGSGVGTIFDTASHTITISTPMSGSGNLTKEGLGTLKLAGNTANFNGDISINEGTLSIGSGASALLTADSNANVVVNNDAALDLTELGASALLNNVSGTGVVLLNYSKSGNGTGFDFSSFTGTVKVNSGRVLLSSCERSEVAPDIVLTTSNSELVFNGNGTVWNGDVSLLADTNIHVNNGKDGEISGTLSGQKLIKRGAGSLTASGGVNLSTLETRDGTVEISGQNNEVSELAGALEGSTKGKLSLSEQAQLTVTGDIKAGIHANTDFIVLEEGSSLTSTQNGVVISNRQGINNTGLKRISGNNDEAYSVGSSSYELSNGHLAYTKNENVALNNKLTNTSISFSPENAAATKNNHTMTVTHAGNTLNGILAEGGNIIVQNQASLNLQELKVAAGYSLSAYKGSTISAADEAVINVSQRAQFGSGATLNADLVMESGATLHMDGSVAMGSNLTLETGLTLSGSKYDEVRSQLNAGGGKVVLFEGIDKLILGNTEYASSITMEDQMLAQTYFGNLGNEYLLVYDATVLGNGVLSIMSVVPEPSTATLSLLALAALAARRRRR